MESDTLRKALVDFIADVLVEAKARAVGDVEAHVRQMLEKERMLLDRERVPVVPVPPRPESRFLDMKQAGQRLSMKGPAFRKMLERTEVPKGIVIRFGRRLRVDIYAFEKWLVEKGTR